MEIFFEICRSVSKRHVMFLQERVHLEARLHFKEAADLRFRQGARPIAFNGDHFERSSRDVVPSTLERRRYIVGRSIVTFMMPPILAPMHVGDGRRRQAVGCSASLPGCYPSPKSCGIIRKALWRRLLRDRGVGRRFKSSRPDHFPNKMAEFSQRDHSVSPEGSVA